MAYLRLQRVPFNDVPLLGAAIDKLAIAGSSLEIGEIEAVQSFLNHIEGLRVRWKDEREAYPKLAANWRSVWAAPSTTARWMNDTALLSQESAARSNRRGPGSPASWKGCSGVPIMPLNSRTRS
jgi:hypothetical protein